MIDQNIKRFCKVVSEINTLNDKLDKERSKFYDGGSSFDYQYRVDIEDLQAYEDEFRKLIKKVQRPDWWQTT